MKHSLVAALTLAMSASNYCFAQSPITVAMSKGPPALLEMEVHNGRVHDIYLTRANPSPSYAPGRVKITISRGTYPDLFQVELAYVELPDGRIFFRVDTPEGSDSDYEIRVMDTSQGATWRELFSGKLDGIPTFKMEHIK